MLTIYLIVILIFTNRNPEKQGLSRVSSLTLTDAIMERQHFLESEGGLSSLFWGHQGCTFLLNQFHSGILLIPSPAFHRAGALPTLTQQ